jgi:hypothetical protein
MAADRCAADGIVSHRMLRERYDAAPKDGDYGLPTGSSRRVEARQAASRGGA